MQLPRDVRPNGGVRDGHHGDGGICGEPEGFIVTAGVIAYVVGIAEQERHRTESLDA